ncbi:MAG: ATP-binding cassette domain-containing protein [Gammaproteobacteria bacterium]|nr:MAG: ATP-binding cassette domain-containing protein [Gammaproteobacteria bacterium]
MTQVALREAVVTYNGHRALGPVTLTTHPDECIVLVGESGAGKSSLLGLIREQVRDRVAWLPQELGLVPQLSVYHNTYMGRLNRYPAWRNVLNLARPWRQAVSDIRPLLASLGIDSEMWKPAGELSGGQKQRVAVARALYQGADMLLADEPVSALDKEWADRVMQLLVSRYPTAVIALHDIDLALRYAHRIIGIRGGQVVMDAPTERLTRDELMALYPSRSAPDVQS